MTKKNPATTSAPFVHSQLSIAPFVVSAIAATAQDFGSGRPAIKAGQQVTLEFGLTQITVHDPFRKSPSENNKLGVILYSYGFSAWDKEHSMDKAAASGQVSKDMFFLFLRIDHDKQKSECRVCGKVWTRSEANLLASEKHLAEHYSL